MSKENNPINTKPIEKKEFVPVSKWSVKDYFDRFFDDLLNLKDGVDKEGTIKEIIDKKSMNGPNAWMLICSIIIASIGLDLNSPAVIIGAMLISPLMSPILGMGLGVGINDTDALKKSGIHFAVAVMIAIITSTIYFFLSPFGEITSEIQARTSPTFLDVFVALFGGIAGIISIARKDISTTLPGVAIATALMPPLCVVGFGIANGEFIIASNAFYLFFLNTFFVSLATYLIIRFLRFPYRQFVSARNKNKNRIITFLFGLLVTIPSFFIFKGVITDFNNKHAVKSFMNECLGNEKEYIDNYTYVKGIEEDTLILRVYGNTISEKKREHYENGLKAAGLTKTKLQIISSSEITKERIAKIDSKIAAMESQAKMLEEAQNELIAKNKLIDSLKNLDLRPLSDSIGFMNFCEELKINYPEMKEVSIAKGLFTNFKKSKNQMVILVNWEDIEKVEQSVQNKIDQLIDRRCESEFVIIHQ